MVFDRIKRHFAEEWREYTTALVCGGIIYFCGYMASRGIKDNSSLYSTKEETRLKQRSSQLISLDIGVQGELMFFQSRYDELISGK